LTSPLHHHLLRPGRSGKIILGNLGIENGKWRMENDQEHTAPYGFQFSILNSQFSILNSVSRLAFFQPIAVLAAARNCGAATT
jgi:hypothetical protein